MPAIILSDNGASSGSAGLKTSGSNDGTLALQTSTAGGTATTAMTINTSQNVGVGVTPSAWSGTGAKGFQVGLSLALGYSNSTGSFVGGNAYWGGSWKRVTTGGATAYLLGTDGTHIWYNTPTSSTPDSAITFTQAMTLDASGNLGVGATSPTAKLDVLGSGTIYSYLRNSTTTALTAVDSSAAYFGSGTSSPVIFQVNNGEKARIDPSGNVGIGCTPNAWSVTTPAIQIGTSAGFIAAQQSQPAVMYLGANAYYNGSAWKYVNTGYATYYGHVNGYHYWNTAPSGTAGATATFTEVLTITPAGYVYFGNGYSSTNHRINLLTAQGNTVLVVSAYSTATNDTALFYSVNGGGANAAACAFAVQKNSSTNRSINAGGTVNASGADYAEYMTKAGAFTVAKGDVVGVDADGKLTNVFSDAVSFVVKSTDPSYVGGDTWGAEAAIGPEPERPKTDWTDEQKAQYEIDRAAFDATLEAARAMVDRIAFAGQVPVNVTGATPGQYIVPVNDNGAIKGEAVSNPTFEQYQQAVGKVIAIEQDGRARIIVKVA